MTESKIVVRLCQLYPAEMNIYADRGNIAVLASRLKWRGMHLEITPAPMGDMPAAGDFDLFYMGGGQDRDQELVARDLLANKAGLLRAALEGGAVGLFVCGGYQLAGHSYEATSGKTLPGLGILDVETKASKDRLIGDILIETSLPQQAISTQPAASTPATQTVAGSPAPAASPPATQLATNSPASDQPVAPPSQQLASQQPAPLEKILVAGYENHAGRTFLGAGALPFGTVKHGNGNNAQDKTEGCIKHHTIGTYLHGPLLPRNPHLSDTILSWALAHRYGTPPALLPLNDQIEEAALADATKRARTPAKLRGFRLGGFR